MKIKALIIIFIMGICLRPAQAFYLFDDTEEAKNDFSTSLTFYSPGDSIWGSIYGLDLQYRRWIKTEYALGVSLGMASFSGDQYGGSTSTMPIGFSLTHLLPPRRYKVTLELGLKYMLLLSSGLEGKDSKGVLHKDLGKSGLVGFYNLEVARRFNLKNSMYFKVGIQQDLTQHDELENLINKYVGEEGYSATYLQVGLTHHF